METAALDQFMGGLQRGELEAAAERLFSENEPAVRSMVLVRAVRAVLDQPAARVALLPYLGRAVEDAAQSGRMDLVLEGLVEAVRVGLGAGLLEEIPGQLDAIESLGKQLRDGFRVYFGRILRGELMMVAGDMGGALTHIDRHLLALEQASGIPDKGALVRYAQNLKMVACAAVGDVEGLAAAVDATRAYFRRSPSAMWTYHHAVLAQAQGRREDAIAGMKAVLASSEGGRDQGWSLDALLALARLEPSANHLERAQAMVSDWGDPVVTQRVAVAVVRQHLDRGRFSDALAACSALDPSQDDLEVLRVLAEALLGADPAAHRREAQVVIQRLLAVAEARGALGTLGEAHLLAAQASGDPTGQDQHLRQALAVFLRLGDAAGRARVQCRQALLDVARGQIQQAIGLALAAEDAGRRLARADLVAAALFARGMAAGVAGRQEERDHCMEGALERAQAEDLPGLVVRCLDALGRSEEARQVALTRGLPEQ